MRYTKLLLALLYLCLSSVGALAENTVGPTNNVICNKFVQATVSTAATTPLISGVAGQSIFICGWHVTTTQTATFPTFQFEYGTQGGPCGAPTVVTPAFNVTNTAPSSDHISIATIQAPAAAQFCVVSGATTTNLAIEVYYSQF
jgi:hypothetical protein